MCGRCWGCGGRSWRSFWRRAGRRGGTDSSNADEAFTRNRLRHHLLPILREYNPAMDQALANLAELAREDEARWQAEVGRVLPQVLLAGKAGARGWAGGSTAAGEAAVSPEIWSGCGGSILRCGGGWCGRRRGRWGRG